MRAPAKPTDPNDVVALLKSSPTVTAETASVALNVGRTQMYAALREGRIPSVRIGGPRGDYRIPSAWLRQQLGITD